MRRQVDAFVSRRRQARPRVYSVRREGREETIWRWEYLPSNPRTKRRLSMDSPISRIRAFRAPFTVSSTRRRSRNLRLWAVIPRSFPASFSKCSAFSNTYILVFFFGITA